MKVKKKPRFSSYYVWHVNAATGGNARVGLLVYRKNWRAVP
jgi:hypothetical protein